MVVITLAVFIAGGKEPFAYLALHLLLRLEEDSTLVFLYLLLLKKKPERDISTTETRGQSHKSHSAEDSRRDIDLEDIGVDQEVEGDNKEAS